MSNDYLKDAGGIEQLPEHLRTPEARAEYQSQVQADVKKKLGEMAYDLKNNPDLLEYRPREGEESVYLENHKARSVHINDADLVINGQLTDASEGPFQRVSERTIRDSMRLQTLLEDEEVELMDGSTITRPPIEKLTREEYTERYRKFQAIRKGRQERAIAQETMTPQQKENADEFTVNRRVTLNMPHDQQ